MKKLIAGIIFTLSLSFSFLLPISKEKGVEIDNPELAKPGMVAYAASYASDPTSEPKYSTQNSKTFQYLNLGHTLEHYRGDSVKVGIIDSGINYDHEDFMVSGSTKVKGDSKYYEYQTSSWVYYKASQHGYSYIDDSLGHGTNVAATVAAAINSVGGTGLAPNVELYVYKVTNSSNGYEFGAIQNALLDAKTLGLDVVNMSFQSYEHEVSYGSSTMSASSGCSTILSYYLNQAYNAGITLVGAAGNYNTDEPSYPGSNSHVINVGSLDQTGTGKAGFSNYGSTIDLVAPGYVHVADEANNTAYTDTSGTSFSAPLVTAAIALYKQKNPSATPAQIESALYASCDSIDDSGSVYTNWAGNGSLNVAKFLDIPEETPVGPTEIVINNPEIVNDELELEIGDYLDLDWTVNGNGTFDHSVNFYTLSGEDDVVTVNSNGKITAISEGSDYVVIESNVDSSVYASVYVTVTSSGSTPTVSSVSVSPSSLSLDLNGTTTGNLSATVNGDNNPSQAVSWGSSNTSIATVSASGVVTAKAVGTATITATSQQDSTKSGSCTVTVTDSTPHPGPTDSTQYSLITSTDDLQAGKSYLITNGTSGTVKTMANTDNGNNRPTTSATISSSKITRGSSILSVTLGGSVGAWTFATDNYAGTAGYLNATSTTGSNYLQVVSSLDKYAYFTISFSNSQAVITCTGKSSRNIVRCNTAGTPIACYSSGQNPVYLWKEITTKTLLSISVNTAPTKIAYEAGDYFDPTGLVITRTYNDNTSDTYSYANHTSEFTFNPTTSTALTTSHTSVTITYGGKSTSQAITVSAAKTLSSITISGYKTTFVEGDTFSFGGTVTAHYSDSSSADVTLSTTFTGYNMANVGNQTVTVSYTHKGTTKTQTYEITVSDGTLSSISVSGMTTEYVKNSPFTFDGTCTATFANGYQKVVTPTSVSSPDMTTGGNKTVTVSYTHNGKTASANYTITVNAYRVVMEDTYSVFASVTYPSNTQTYDSTKLSVSTSGYTTIESNSIRLGSGSNTGTVTVTSLNSTANIYKVVVSAKSYGSDTGVTLTIAGTSNTITSSYSDYQKEFSSPVSSVAIATTTNKKRAHIETITIYNKTSQDIGQTNDCVGLETFINNYMHMDYTENLGYCSDSTHHYYATAKAAFNGLNDHQRKLFTANSAYLVEWTRLSTWASKNGDTLNSSNQLEIAVKPANIIASSFNSDIVIILVIGTLISFGVIGGYFLLRKRREE